jgi:hypothetical protein
MTSKMYSRLDAEQLPFFRIPKILISSSKYRSTSAESKLLYGIMLDRLSLSMKNEWFDEDGYAYIIYTLQEIMRDFHTAKATAVKLLDELEAVGLIVRRHQGTGKPSLIYVLKITPSDEEQEDDSEEPDLPSNSDTADEFKNCTRDTGFKNQTQRVQNLNPNKTDINKTDSNRVSIYPSSSGKTPSCLRESYSDYFSDRFDTGNLIAHNPKHKKMIDSIVDLCADTVSQCDQAETTRIGRKLFPAASVKQRFLTLDSGHIQYFLDCFETRSSRIHNLRAYIQMSLYNAPLTIGFYQGSRTGTRHSRYRPEILPDYTTDRMRLGTEMTPEEVAALQKALREAGSKRLLGGETPRERR